MIDRQNYKFTRDYLLYRERILQNDPKTLRNAWMSLKHLLRWADSKPLNDIASIRQTFPDYLCTARADTLPGPLSPEHMEKVMSFVRDMLRWAKLEHPGKFRRISETWIRSLHVRRSIGSQSHIKEREFYTLEEVRRIIKTPTPDDISIKYLRDKSALAFLFLSGIRDGAFVTLPLEAVDVKNRRVSQFPRLGVQTKGSKAATTFLLPIPDLLMVIENWDALLRSYGQPRLAWYTRLRWEGLDANDLVSLDRDKPSGRIGSLRNGLRYLCELAGVKYKSPHKARHGHGVYGMKHARTMEELKAHSQNMMHSTVAITDGTYGNLISNDVADIISTFTPDQ